MNINMFVIFNLKQINSELIFDTISISTLLKALVYAILSYPLSCSILQPLQFQVSLVPTMSASKSPYE